MTKERELTNGVVTGRCMTGDATLHEVMKLVTLYGVPGTINFVKHEISVSFVARLISVDASTLSDLEFSCIKDTYSFTQDDDWTL